MRTRVGRWAPSGVTVAAWGSGDLRSTGRRTCRWKVLRLQKARMLVHVIWKKPWSKDTSDVCEDDMKCQQGISPATGCVE